MKRLLFVMVLAVCAVVLVSCGKDDYIAPDVDLKSYIIGTWHSYKITAYANGQYKSADITKINEYSAAYMEMNFSSDNRVAISGWMVNGDGTSRWITENGVYSIEENTVHVRENVAGDGADGLSFEPSVGGLTRSGDNGEVVSFVFEPSLMSLYVRYSTVVNGMNVIGDLYLRK